MTRRRWTIIGSVVLSAAVLGTCGESWIWSKGPTPRQVERQIRADAPIGTPRSAVEDYLRGRGIRFTAVEWEPLAEVAEEAGLGNREVRSFIQATVEPSFVSLVLPGEVVVYFLFDREGRLLGYTFRPFAHAL